MWDVVSVSKRTSWVVVSVWQISGLGSWNRGGPWPWGCERDFHSRLPGGAQWEDSTTPHEAHPKSRRCIWDRVHWRGGSVGVPSSLSLQGTSWTTNHHLRWGKHTPFSSLLLPQCQRRPHRERERVCVSMWTSPSSPTQASEISALDRLGF